MQKDDKHDILKKKISSDIDHNMCKWVISAYYSDVISLGT